jgi:hypothetical protein
MTNDDSEGRQNDKTSELFELLSTLEGQDVYCDVIGSISMLIFFKNVEFLNEINKIVVYSDTIINPIYVSVDDIVDFGYVDDINENIYVEFENGMEVIIEAA